MLVIVFTSYIALATATNNIYSIVGLMVLRGIGSILYGIVTKNPFQKTTVTLLKIIGIGISVVLIIAYKQANYIPDDTRYFNGTGEIVSLYKEGKVIFKSRQGQEYLLKTSTEYEIGQQIFLSAKNIIHYTPSYPHLLTTKSLDQQWRNISKDTLTIFDPYKFNYEKRLFMRGITAELEEVGNIKLERKNLDIFQYLKQNLYTKVNTLYRDGKTAGLLLGMLIGDRYQLTDSDYEGFKNSGLVHIIAVSGGNIIIIAVFLGLLFAWLPFYLRQFLILICIILYAVLCGLDSSVVRATIMGGLGIMAVFFGREVPIYRLLKISFVSMLLRNPYYLLYDIGFILSFSAIIGILVFNTWVRRNSPKAETRIQKIKRYFQSILYPTIGATLGVLPILLFFMDKINMIGVVANIIVVPLVSFVMIGAFVTSFLYAWMPWGILALPITWIVKYIFTISSYATEYGIYIQFSQGWLKYFCLIGWVGYVVYFLMTEKYNTQEKRIV